MYITGFYTPQLNVPLTNIGGTMLNTGATSASQNIFVIYYDANGRFLWGRNIDSTANDQGLSITNDVNETVYLTGFSSQTLSDVGGFMSGSYLGGSDGFILTYNKDGGFVWGKYINGTTTSNEQILSIIADNTTSIYIAGFCGNALTNLGGTMINSFAGGEEGFLIKLNRLNGNFLWGRYLKSTGSVNERALHVSVDKLDNVYVGGFCSAALTDLGGNMSNAFQSSNDGFIIKYI